MDVRTILRRWFVAWHRCGVEGQHTEAAFSDLDHVSAPPNHVAQDEHPQHSLDRAVRSSTEADEMAGPLALGYAGENSVQDRAARLLAVEQSGGDHGAG